MTELVTRLRKIASRGRMDDADVQVVFDGADEIERLRAKVALLSERLPEDARILDVCAGLDADTVEAALFIAQEVRSFQPLLLADWKLRSER